MKIQKTYRGLKVMKKVTVLLLSVMFLLALSCSGFAASKVGIITMTTSQGEEDYRAAEEMQKKYGKDRVLHSTYPDKFVDEQETTIQQILSFAADKDMKAIIFTQGLPGVSAAIEKVRSMGRKDIIFINCMPHEDPEISSKLCDVIVETDNIERGHTIVLLAKKMGAKTFVHYSFPRHMSIFMMSKRRDEMESECKKQGMKFLFVNAPDPTGDAGIAGAQQFILEDQARQIAKYGKNTAFFSTNCAMQEPLIKSILKNGGIYPEQCDPSPYHALPGALGIKIPADKAGNTDFIIKAINASIVKNGGAGRFATWKVPAIMSMTYAATDYGILYGDGKVKRTDMKKMESLLRKHAGNIKAQIYNVAGKDGKKVKLNNFLLFVGESVIFGGKTK